MQSSIVHTLWLVAGSIMLLPLISWRRKICCRYSGTCPLHTAQSGIPEKRRRLRLTRPLAQRAIAAPSGFDQGRLSTSSFAVSFNDRPRRAPRCFLSALDARPSIRVRQRRLSHARKPKSTSRFPRPVAGRRLRRQSEMRNEGRGLGCRLPGRSGRGLRPGS